MFYKNLNYCGFLRVLGEPDTLCSWIDFYKECNHLKDCEITKADWCEIDFNFKFRFCNNYRCDLEV